MELNKYYQNALLTEASYTKFEKIVNPDGTYHDDDVKTALINIGGDGEGFSPTQAADFADHWKVVRHQPNTFNGFSATLFQYIGPDDASGSYQQGDLVYALRGTEGVAGLDLWKEDIGNIVTDGLAMEQIVDMYNDWGRIQAGKGKSYTAAHLDTDYSLTAARLALRTNQILLALYDMGKRSQVRIVYRSMIQKYFTMAPLIRDTIYGTDGIAASLKITERQKVLENTSVRSIAA